MAASGLSSAQAAAQDEPEEVYFGSARAKIVGVRYYTGVISDLEQAVLLREPNNAYDRNAVCVLNAADAKLGHIPKEVAAWMAGLLDGRRCTIEAMVPKNAKRDGFSITLDLHAFGPIGNASVVQAKLRTLEPHFLNYDYDSLAGPPQDWIAYAHALRGGSSSGASGQGYGSTGMARGPGAIDADGAVSKHLDNLFAERVAYEDMPEAAQPEALATPLYPHQTKALWWMIERERHTTVAEALERQAAQAAPGTGKKGMGASGAAGRAGAGAGAGAAGAGSSSSSAAAVDTTAAIVTTAVNRAVAVNRAFFWQKDARGLYLNTASGNAVKDPPPLPMGGILADEMGLGKTMTTVALVVAQRAADLAIIQKAGLSHNAAAGGGAAAAAATGSGKPSPAVLDTIYSTAAGVLRPSLIVAPVSVLSVWRDHFEGYVKDAGLRVYVHHGPGRETSATTIAKSYDVVITSYSTLEIETNLSALEPGAAAAAAAGAGAGSSAAGGAGRASTSTQSPLQRLKWRRVILDEAHMIKNKSSRTAKACFGLKTDVRWCITGTPIQNKLDDLFSLVKFLRLFPFDQEQWWKSLIVTRIRSGQVEGFERLAGLLATFCLRRTKAQRVGPGQQPILQLPDKETHVISVELRLADRQAYDGLSAALRSAVDRLESEDRSGRGLLGASADIFEVLMRLRQLACHSALVPAEKLQAAAERARDLSSSSNNKNSKGKAGGGDTLQDITDVANVRKLARCLHEAVEEGQDCPICLDTLLDPVITLCAHIFCSECIGNLLATKAIASGKKAADCPLCRAAVQDHSISTVAQVEARLEALDGAGGDNEDTKKPAADVSSAAAAAAAAAGNAGGGRGAGLPGSAKVDALIAAIKALIAGGNADDAANAGRQATYGFTGGAGASSSAAATGAAAAGKEQPEGISAAAAASVPMGHTGDPSGVASIVQSASADGVSIAAEASVPAAGAGAKGGRGKAGASKSAVVSSSMAAGSSVAAVPAGAGDASSAAGPDARSRSGRAVKRPAHLEGASFSYAEGDSDEDDDAYDGPTGDRRKRKRVGKGAKAAASGDNGDEYGGSSTAGRRMGGRAAAGLSRADAGAGSALGSSSSSAITNQISGSRSKSVVFSQFTSLLDIVQDRLSAAGIRWVRLDGSMPAAVRQDAANRFQTDPTVHVFLVSIRAGGTGLTLTAAANVFVLDPPYNPAAQDQAVDRVHRLGQSTHVHVHLLVAKRTVEEAILELQDRKRALAAASLVGAKADDIARHRLNDLRLLIGSGSGAA